MSHVKFAVLILAFLVGCSTVPLTEDEIYEKENKRILIIEQHDLDIISCKNAGGVMVYEVWSASKIKRPLRIYEMKTAKCVDPQWLLDEISRRY